MAAEGGDVAVEDVESGQVAVLRSTGIDNSSAAAQLWFNVGVGLPEGLTGTGWAAFAVACTAAGLVLVTALIGIGIRRLVR